jgi:TIR domain
VNRHHFISYSRYNAEEFAVGLYDQLLGGPPSIPVWLDSRKLRPGQNWAKEINEAIRSCESLIFVMTSDSVESQSVCEEEWTSTLRYKKPVIPIQLDPEAETPFRLKNRQYLSFTGDYEVGLAQLRNHLRWLTSPEGATLGNGEDLGEQGGRCLVYGTNGVTPFQGYSPAHSSILLSCAPM